MLGHSLGGLADGFAGETWRNVGDEHEFVFLYLHIYTVFLFLQWLFIREAIFIIFWKKCSQGNW